MHHQRTPRSTHAVTRAVLVRLVLLLVLTLSLLASATTRADPGDTRLFLPLLAWGDRGVLPDLVVSAINTHGGRLEVVITNMGGSAVTQPFWVDLNIAPSRQPTGPNQTWELLGNTGMVWGVAGRALPLRPGSKLTLTPGDDLYSQIESRHGGPIAQGIPIYVQVDSAAVGSAVGAVLEGHEQARRSYNNIARAVAVAPVSVRLPAIGPETIGARYDRLDVESEQGRDPEACSCPGRPDRSRTDDERAAGEPTDSALDPCLGQEDGQPLDPAVVVCGGNTVEQGGFCSSWCDTGPQDEQGAVLDPPGDATVRLVP